MKEFNVASFLSTPPFFNLADCVAECKFELASGSLVLSVSLG